MWFFLNLYLQQILDHSASPSGSALLPMTILIMTGMIALAPRAINHFGPKAMVVTGLAPPDVTEAAAGEPTGGRVDTTSTTTGR